MKLIIVINVHLIDKKIKKQYKIKEVTYYKTKRSQ